MSQNKDTDRINWLEKFFTVDWTGYFDRQSPTGTNERLEMTIDVDALKKKLRPSHQNQTFKELIDLAIDGEEFVPDDEAVIK